VYNMKAQHRGCAITLRLEDEYELTIVVRQVKLHISLMCLNIANEICLQSKITNMAIM